MSHTYSKIWLHFIWSTHERVSLIAPNWKSELINHFKENSQKKAIYIDTANGVSDHFHLLINLS
ncbi:MAG: transposase, partial [archaeon]